MKTLLFSVILLTLADSAGAIDMPIPNPITAQTFGDLVIALANAVRLIGIPLAALAIIITGFRFVTASLSGKPDDIASARKVFWWVLIGTALVVGGSVIATAVVNTVQQL